MRLELHMATGGQVLRLQCSVASRTDAFDGLLDGPVQQQLLRRRQRHVNGIHLSRLTCEPPWFSTFTPCTGICSCYFTSIHQQADMWAWDMKLWVIMLTRTYCMCSATLGYLNPTSGNGFEGLYRLSMQVISFKGLLSHRALVPMFVPELVN